MGKPLKRLTRMRPLVHRAESRGVNETRSRSECPKVSGFGLVNYVTQRRGTKRTKGTVVLRKRCSSPLIPLLASATRREESVGARSWRS